MSKHFPDDNWKEPKRKQNFVPPLADNEIPDSSGWGEDTSDWTDDDWDNYYDELYQDDDLGGTGHGDDSLSDADPGL